ncbi:hypothetical protein DN752_09965 [Echinicola strongylocentroti]|uniref:Uncharacterized protein n=1 Tax=Echinicola strongylocentroti TaxID=1795355 RepID=A0A2Z4IGY8_9BACT|nr:hypothetical protein [Echinicola strongylocentroti]AWW30421.1 hypothetical protein DN752_09965 [Echinicola strongylocentroti]
MMEEEIRALLAKYYEGETSLEEEGRLKELLKQSTAFEEERMFVLGLEEMAQNEPSHKASPGAGKGMWAWQKMAAIVAVFLALGWLFFEQQKRMQEEEAYRQVVEALSLIQQNMEKGTSSMKPLEDIRYLGATDELFNIKEIKEEK